MSQGPVGVGSGWSGRSLRGRNDPRLHDDRTCATTPGRVLERHCTAVESRDGRADVDGLHILAVRLEVRPAGPGVVGAHQPDRVELLRLRERLQVVEHDEWLTLLDAWRDEHAAGSSPVVLAGHVPPTAALTDPFDDRLVVRALARDRLQLVREAQVLADQRGG